MGDQVNVLACRFRGIKSSVVASRRVVTMGGGWCVGFGEGASRREAKFPVLCLAHVWNVIVECSRNGSYGIRMCSFFAA